MINYCETCRYRYDKKSEKRCRECSKGHILDCWEPAEATEIKIERRPEMLPKPLPIYEHTDSEIPEKVRISFTNGTSAIYELHVEQPAPVIIENIKIIRRMKQGYVNQPMRRRNRK